MPIIALLAIPTRIQAWSTAYALRNWGNVASAWGLGVSIYLISIARGARKAAQDATAIEKTRSALQGLKQAAEKNTQVGVYARSAKWDATQIRAEEVMICCHSTVARWKDNPIFKESSNDLLMTATQMHSIILETAKANVRVNNILNAQVTASEKLSGVIGQIEKQQADRGSD